MADEKEIRLHEVEQLKAHCDGHGVGVGNEDHTIRMFIRNRVAAIEKMFEAKPEEAPAQEPLAQQQGAPAQEGAQGGQQPPVHKA